MLEAEKNGEKERLRKNRLRERDQHGFIWSVFVWTRAGGSNVCFLTDVYVPSLVLFLNRYLVPFSSLFRHGTIVVTPRGDNKPDSPKKPETHT